MADIDHFKRVNDTYGHLAGDAVLSAVADAVQKLVRPYDAVGRYGGEEFLIALPGSDEPAALRVADRVRRCISSTRVRLPEGEIPVTMSLGVATARAAAPSDAGGLIRAADAALYRAKEGGRDRVELARDRGK